MNVFEAFTAGIVATIAVVTQWATLSASLLRTLQALGIERAQPPVIDVRERLLAIAAGTGSQTQ